VHKFIKEAVLQLRRCMPNHIYGAVKLNIVGWGKKIQNA